MGRKTTTVIPKATSCINYEDNGLHYSHPWVVGVEEEMERPRKPPEEVALSHEVAMSSCQTRVGVIAVSRVGVCC
ncbi:hypothetical protein Bca52824_093126 [Brassica carinata]|uniref:Uncharacterized protein n=1 Tax=Brassica carinata TaxID=52824 RepID=A0A8X7TK59_BRACI|nr:hypothetical protein Bca52824_093126 [Brassica carinata]